MTLLHYDVDFEIADEVLLFQYRLALKRAVSVRSGHGVGLNPFGGQCILEWVTGDPPHSIASYFALSAPIRRLQCDRGEALIAGLAGVLSAGILQPISESG